jgi:hypothetical protein
MNQPLPLGKGKATAITDADIASLARTLRCHPAHIEAIAEVESNGFGWFPDGRIKILFEKHWFYKLIPEAKRANAVKNGLARKNWISPQKGGYKDQPDADARYKLLERAIRVDREAAFKSISMGKFQIMGFNHKICGHQSAEQMFNAFCESEVYQLTAFAGFLVNNKLESAIQGGDFDRIEQVYNGGGLNGAYAKKMRAAAAKLKAGKWANWDAKEAPKPAPATTPAAKPETPASKPPASPVGLIVTLAAIAIAGIGTALSGAWDALLKLMGL